MTSTQNKQLRTAAYERPVKAMLRVHLETGEEWIATEEDLARFGLDYTNAAYYRFDRALARILAVAGLCEREDLTRGARLNTLRYLAETAICHPDLLDHSEHKGWPAVVAIEKALVEAFPDPDTLSYMASEGDDE